MAETELYSGTIEHADCSFSATFSSSGGSASSALKNSNASSFYSTSYFDSDAVDSVSYVSDAHYDNVNIWLSMASFFIDAGIEEDDVAMDVDSGDGISALITGDSDDSETYWHRFLVAADALVSIRSSFELFNATFLDMMEIPDDCGDNLVFRVYDAWTANNGMIVSYNGTDCDNIVGNYYDPINSCESDSNSELVETGFCNCTDYSCNTSDYFNGVNRFGCSPSDLSGKYGALPIDLNFSINITFTDDLSITNAELEGKSLVIQCQDSYEKVVCAKFVSYNYNVSVTTPTSTGVNTIVEPNSTMGENESKGMFIWSVNVVSSVTLLF